MCYFKAHELVDPVTYKIYGEKKSFRFIDKQIIAILQFLRDYYKSPIIINNYKFGGKLKNRGLRLEGKYFKRYSCHSFGRAVDINVKNVDSAKLQNDILNVLHEELKLLGLTAIEKDTPTWTHISVSNFDGWNVEENNGIKILKG